MLGQIVYSSHYRGLSYIDGTNKQFVYLNGQVLDRTSWPLLDPFFPVGTYGSTLSEIVLPDLTHVYWRGMDLGRGADVDKASRIATSGTDPTGDNLGAYQDASMPLHTHAFGTCPSSSAYINQSGLGGANLTPGTRNTDTTPQIYGSGIFASGTAATSFDLASVTYFPYLGAD
jgi:hypothetical protein